MILAYMGCLYVVYWSILDGVVVAYVDKSIMGIGTVISFGAHRHYCSVRRLRLSSTWRYRIWWRLATRWRMVADRTSFCQFILLLDLQARQWLTTTITTTIHPTTNSSLPHKVAQPLAAVNNYMTTTPSTSSVRRLAYLWRKLSIFLNHVRCK